MTRTSRALSYGATAVALVVLAGCSSSTDGSGTAAPSSDSSQPSAAGSSAPSSTASSTSSTAAGSSATSGSSGSASGLASALLTAGEVGAGYTASATDNGNGSPLPCTPTKPPVFTQAPPKEKVQQAYANSGATVEISETVAEYDEESGAQQAYTVGVAGFSCSSGSLAGETVRIVKRAGGSPNGGGVDQFAAWDFANSKLKGTAVLVRQGDHITAMTFGAAASSTEANSVPVGDILGRAITKVNAHD